METYNDYPPSTARTQELEIMIAQKDKVIDDIRKVVKSLEEENTKLRTDIRTLVLNRKKTNRAYQLMKKLSEFKLQSPIVKK